MISELFVFDCPKPVGEHGSRQGQTLKITAKRYTAGSETNGLTLLFAHCIGTREYTSASGGLTTKFIFTQTRKYGSQQLSGYSLCRIILVKKPIELEKCGHSIGKATVTLLFSIALCSTRTIQLVSVSLHFDFS
jgi:hypothetical protein